MHLLQLKFEFGHRIDVICAVFVLLCSDRVRGMIVLLCSGSVCVCEARVRVGEVCSPAMQA